MSKSYREHVKYRTRPTKRAQGWFDGELVGFRKEERGRPSPRAQGWLDGELASFRKEEKSSLSDLIDSAAAAQWFADNHHA